MGVAGNCRSIEFRCMNGQCIIDTQRCDGIRHCTDNTDEMGCAYLTVFIARLTFNVYVLTVDVDVAS